MTKLQELTKAIHEAVPDIRGLGRDITLADVLIVLQEYPHITFRHYFKGNLQFEQGGKLLGIWWLGKPLHLQSQETIDFLHEIICNT